MNPLDDFVSSFHSDEVGFEGCYSDAYWSFRRGRASSRSVARMRRAQQLEQMDYDDEQESLLDARLVRRDFDW